MKAVLDITDPALNEARMSRMDAVNQLIDIIARHGRRFFAHRGSVSYFTLSNKGRLIWVDAWSHQFMYASAVHRSKHFTEGHTLRTLIRHLSQYIMHGTPVPLPHGDLWGYGEDMATIREAAGRLQISAVVREDGEPR